VQTIGKRVLSFRNPYDNVTGSIDTNDTRLGSSVDGWQQRMMQGLDCSTPYSRISRKVTVKSQGNWSWEWRDRPNSSFPWTTRTAYGWGLIAPGPISSVTSLPVAVDNKAKSKFLSKLNGVSKSMDGGVALGEIRQVIDQLRHPLKSFRTSIDDFITTAHKRGRKRARKEKRDKRDKSDVDTRRRAVVSAITGTYLEWKFGVQPTLNDIDGLLQALDRKSGRLWDLNRIRAGASWGQVIPDTTEYANASWVLAGTGMSGPQQMAQVKVRRSVVINGRVTYSGAVAIESPETSLRKELGLMPRDFVPTVWNLLPWSWAVDYAFNVGNVIEAVCASYGSVRWCNQAIRQCVTETWDTGGLVTKTFSNSFNREDMGQKLNSPSIVEIESLSYSRIPYEAGVVSFMPRFVLEVPSAVKMLNLTSALWHANKVSRDLDSLIRFG
jgi:hypothetical protein